MQEDYSETDNDYKDLTNFIPKQSSTLFTTDQVTSILKDSMKHDMKNKFTSLSYQTQTDIYRTHMENYSLSSPFQLGGGVDDTNSIPVELIDKTAVKSVCSFIQTALPDVFGHLHRAK